MSRIHRKAGANPRKAIIVKDQPIRGWLLFLLLFCFAITIAVRIRLLNVPFERDEGEYAYVAQLMLKGSPPYGSAYSMKFPGIYVVYALIMACMGQTMAAVRLGLLLVNVSTALVLFFLVRRVYDSWTVVFSCASFLFLSLNPDGHGLSANAEHFVLLPAIGGILLLLFAVDSGALHAFFLSGLLLGIGYVIKQHGVFFAAFAIVYLLVASLYFERAGWRKTTLRLAVHILGLGMPFGAASILLWRAGVFDNFWFWTMTYSHKYATQLTLVRGLRYYLPDSLKHVVLPCLPLWLLHAIGVFLSLWRQGSKKKIIFEGCFGLASLLSIFPAYFFRRHYFILMLPFVAMMSGFALARIAEFVERSRAARFGGLVQATVFIAAIAPVFYWQGDTMWRLSPNQVSREIYGAQPFPESIEVASYVRNNSSPDDLIAVIGSEPQIYFYANRKAAIPYIYMYPLMEAHGKALEMQRDLIARVERAKPKYIVFVRIPTSWALWPGAPLLILEWTARYTLDNYRRVGIVEIADMNVTNYYWGDDVMRAPSGLGLGIEVFQRVD